MSRTSNPVRNNHLDDGDDLIENSIRKGNIKQVERAISNYHLYPQHYFSVHIAAESGELKILELMVTRLPFVDINGLDSSGLTCLAMACWRNRSNVVRYLCTIDKINLNMKVTKAENTALHIAASYNYTDIVLMLLRAGAEKSIENYYGRNPAQEAMNRGYTEMADMITNFENHLSFKLKLKRQILEQDSYSEYKLSDIIIKTRYEW